ncbi:Npt1/Npt2 family nucleotide transporter [Candidatus Bandiella euplotis]|uniref:ADP,ATP carrier protein n=1 Tax=Candidatus Bandiella euplotis TaxID=1664265 RepID=A0ABZ0URE9_9RICK|nr:Npt1/Npt2 family nucleotide transporter [Candidatus Bandiella woodruffii]WPX96605.1 Tlc1 type NTP/NDP exchange transporter [Candidatus Bandiella woodruffii]
MIDIYKYLPVRKEEFSKFIVISLMMVLIVFVYSIQRITKDTIVVSYMGAELISTIKLYGVLPAAILFTLIYTKLSSVLNKTIIFHLFNLLFIGYFVLFSFVIFPNIQDFHIDLSAVSSQFPVFRYLFVMFEDWAYSLYYIYAELWGSLMLALMFWQIANQVFKIEEAKRLYPLFGLVAQIGMLMAGQLTKIFTNQSYTVNGWQDSLIYINSSVAIGGVVLSLLFWILSNVLVSNEVINAETKKSKKKIGFLEGLKYVFTSKYIGLIALLILCYGFSINLVEGVWKAQARMVYPNPQDYAGFMGVLQTYTGLVCMAAMLTGSYIMRIISWRTAALLTPMIIVITGIIFFVFSIYQVEIMQLLPFLTLVPIVVAVYAGLIQNILSKATKYAFFDATKEMAYIPLDEALKSKGKAAADVIGSRVGKSSGAVIQWVMLSAIPGATLVNLSPIFFGVFLVIMVVWFVAVFMLAKEFNKITN